jgi:hypothetical protein
MQTSLNCCMLIESFLYPLKIFIRNRKLKVKDFHFFFLKTSFKKTELRE